MRLTMKIVFSLLVLDLLCARESLRTHAQGIPELSKCGKVFITISSLQHNYVEMNWITKCNNTDEVPDIIALYSNDPRTSVKPLQSVSFRHYNGYFITPIKFGSPWLPGEWDYYENMTAPIPGSHCLPFWIASVKRNRIIDLNCLKIHPTWMDDNRSIMAPLKIGTTFIPGTHNSGAYGKMAFGDYILNQNVDIWSQLVYGIRYFDLRVGYYKGDGFYINHDLVQFSPLLPTLRTFKKFSEFAPKEVIVIDFHRFPYPSDFDKNTHRKLVAIIEKELGDLAYPPTGMQVVNGPTFNEIWLSNKSMVICYANIQMSVENVFWLWGPLKQYWGNKNDVWELKEYLELRIKGHYTSMNPLWALMAELTLTPFDLFSSIFKKPSNAKNADKVNRELTKWFRDEWARETNIVASDYFLGNDLINVAIEANRLK